MALLGVGALFGMVLQGKQKDTTNSEAPSPSLRKPHVWLFLEEWLQERTQRRVLLCAERQTHHNPQKEF